MSAASRKGTPVSATRLLTVDPSEIAPIVLLPGDPGRAEMIASTRFEDVKEFVRKREFVGFTGAVNGERVSVLSTGLGAPGAGMMIEDLALLGAQVLIRVGTAGSVQEHVHPGDLVVATGAVREEGLSLQHIPAVFPAVADPDLVVALKAAAANVGGQGACHAGIVHTCDAFRSDRLQAEREMYQQAGVLAYEMETSAVLTLGQLRGMRAGSVLAIDGYASRVLQGDVVPDATARDRAIQQMIDVALATVPDIELAA